MAQEVCSDQGWELVDLEPDQAISAYKGLNRIKGSLGAFLKRVKAGEISKGSVLIIEKMDRFSRSEVDLVLPDFLGLLQAGIEIYSCVDRTHYTLAAIRKNPMTLNYAVMAMAMASDYSKSLGDRVTRSVNIRLNFAKHGTKVDFGPWNPAWIDFVEETKGTGRFEFNASAETVKRICREYSSGSSMYAITKGLIADKVATLRGGKWCQQTISNILSNPALLGNVTIKDTELKGYYPALLTQAEYDKLQAKLGENKSRKGGSEPSDYIANLWRNRCKCAHCGETISTKKKNTRHLFTCKGKKTGTCESAYAVNANDIELDFFIHFLKESPGDLLRKQTPETNEKIASVQADISRYDKEIKDTTALIGVVPVEELRTKLIETENKRQAAKAELDRLNASMLSSQSAPKALASVKGILGELSTDETGHVDRTSPAYAGLVRRVTSHLKANETRKVLLGLLPSLVKNLVVDTTNKRYAVINHSNQQSAWRTLRPFNVEDAL